jgi:prephenate dehydratase
VVRSHPVALDQCRRLLDGLPGVTLVATATTADAAHDVAQRGDPTHVAIASERAARLNGLTVLADNVGDHPEAYTRFVSIATYIRLERGDGTFRTALSFVTDHRPGALNRALEPFARFEIDLVQLVSRPIPQTPWRYRFDAVLAGHPLDPPVRGALREASAQTRLLRVLGAYPVTTRRR